VYKIPHDNWSYSDGLLFLDDQLLDDKNMSGGTIGIRRVQTPFRDLFPLKKSLINHIGILKQTGNTFIDSQGDPFIYEKTLLCKLKYFKIRKVDRKGVASLLWVKGINFPFTIPRPPEDGRTWAGILHLHNIPWLLYEYSEVKLKDTRRKV
tara:strand:- start:15874 stop:16326 length:453 start_codon:yes stop_codon:yes gene_type:complete